MGDVEEIVRPLEALARRCEEATGPDYALDCAIWDAIYPGERQERFDKLTAKGQPYHGRLGPADVDGYVKPLRAFTASLDAAMTLVPEYSGCSMVAVTGNRWSVLLYNENVMGGGSSRALALCAAALKARDHLLSNPSRMGE